MQTKNDIRTAKAGSVGERPGGICGGTTVLTLAGELPVEHLVRGDRVITRDSGTAVLRGVRVTEVRIAPIRIKAGSLGHTRPDRDMIVAPHTMIHIRDWRAMAMYGTPTAMVPASQLVDGEFVAEQGPATIRLFSLVFDRDHIVYADGLEVAAA